ncbi:MAG TPA: hypothetical protein VL123_00900 [Candidatus Udaeobacter sp.]|jgi:folate-binding protein YgfZ|nr:hypothetical protein [Candidatus Udaeobacter sp.]
MASPVERSLPRASTGLEPGVVRLLGRDALSLLHNISTQRMLDLEPGDARLALFCDFRGRLLHRVVAARTRDGAVWLVREDQSGDSLAAHLDRSVFREDVTIEDLSADYAVVPRVAPDAVAAVVVEHDDQITRLHAPGMPELRIGSAGTPADAEPFDPAAWERERIGMGWGRHGREVAPEFHPFEVNLGHGVHLDKGCFTGQETLMRLVTYRSIRRRLVRLEGEGPAPAAGALRSEDVAPAGVITSVSGDGARWSALAVVRREACESAETRLSTEDGRPVRIAEVFAWRSPDGRPLGL